MSNGTPYRYAETEPLSSGWLRVDEIHAIHFCEWGTPDGIPAVELHGGPGAGTQSEYARLYDPAREPVPGRSARTGEATAGSS